MQSGIIVVKARWGAEFSLEITKMTTLFRCALGAAAVCGLALGATPAIEVSGEYVEARTADVYTGPCFANSEVQLVGNLAVFGWKIEKGQ